MPLTPISEIRKRELILAAQEVLETQGVTGATLERVAEKAGASKGIVLHYFKTKQQLFIDVMRFANANLRIEVVNRMAQAKSPQDRLWAIVTANLAGEFFTSARAQSWLALCAEVPREVEFKRLQVVIHARMHSNLVSALKYLVRKDDVNECAIGLSSLIDGLWLRMAINPTTISRSNALDIMRNAISGQLGSFTPQVGQDH